jgi:hypothetical protein
MENQIKINDNGPLQVSGDFQIFDAEGKEYQKKAKVYLCRCGLSNKSPFVMVPIRKAALKAVLEPLNKEGFIWCQAPLDEPGWKTPSWLYCCFLFQACLLRLQGRVDKI